MAVHLVARIDAGGRARPPVRRGLYLPVMSWPEDFARWDEDTGFAELGAVDDADELCRLLLESPSGWGFSTRHVEAVEVLSKVRGTGTLPASFLALLLCSCRRWRTVTTRLIAAIDQSGLLGGAELDQLAEWFLAYEQLVIEYTISGRSLRWSELDFYDARRRIYAREDETRDWCRLWFEPPLRRWAARRALRAEPDQLAGLLARAEALTPRDRETLIQGLLDGADVLEEGERRRLIRAGLRTGQASVRRTALDRLCELDGAQSAIRRARSDPSATVRKWRPRNPPRSPGQSCAPGHLPDRTASATPGRADVTA